MALHDNAEDLARVQANRECGAPAERADDLVRAIVGRAVRERVRAVRDGARVSVTLGPRGAGGLEYTAVLESGSGERLLVGSGEGLCDALAALWVALDPTG